jgi:hypothetical protein
VSYWLEGALGSLDAATALAFLLAVLSFRWWVLGPASLVCLALGQDFAFGAVLVGLGLSLIDHMERDAGPWWKNRPGVRKAQILFLLSLFGLVLFWGEVGLEPWGMALLPWLWYRPIETWMEKNSGGGVMWIPLLMASSLMVFFPRVGLSSHFLEATLGAFFLLVAWYRRIPMGLKFLSLVLGCSFWLVLSFQRMDLFLVMLGMALLQALESWREGKSSCRKMPWALYFGVVWGGLLIYHEASADLVWLPMVLLLFGTHLLSEEICRLCLASTRCREKVFSVMASRLPLLFGLLWSMGSVNPMDLVWLFFFALGAESTKSVRLRPVTESVIQESSCRTEWEKSFK